jgi:hypothetical protein
VHRQGAAVHGSGNIPGRRGDPSQVQVRRQRVLSQSFGGPLGDLWGEHQQVELVDHGH